MSQPWKLLCKFIIAGDSNVGKSSILVRLTEDRFIMDQDPTIGVEFGSHLIDLENGETIKIQVWDTAGSEQFRSITRSYYRGAAGALLVYSVAHRPSFENVKAWLEDVRSHAEESVSIVLVGNQVDLCQDEEEDEEDQDSEELEGSDETEGQEEGQKQKQKQRTVEEGIAETSKPKKKSKLKKRQVSTKEAREFAEKEGIMFVETSAKTGQNVEEAFTLTAKDIHTKFLSKYSEPNNNSIPSSHQTTSNEGGSSGRRRNGNGGRLDLNGSERGGKNGCCLLM